MYSPPSEPVFIKDPKHKLLWFKYLFFEQGISPKEFNDTRMKDIMDIVDIHDAFRSKENRNVLIYNAKAKAGIR